MNKRYNPKAYAAIVLALRELDPRLPPAGCRYLANYYAKLQGDWQSIVSRFAKENVHLYR